jgi:hypothetical protein
MATAALMAQLSFWNPTEEQLPLKLMENYLKGMRCDAGTDRAYSIMNTRIENWLRAQAGLKAEE